MKQGLIRVLSVRYSCLFPPQICSEVYARQSDLPSEAPFCVATFAATLGPEFGDTGAVAGVLTTYVLPEAGASLYVAVLGTCHTLGKNFDPLLPHYYTEGCAQSNIEFAHEQQMEKEGNRFTWQCFCFRGDTLPLENLHPALTSLISSDPCSPEGKRIILYGVAWTMGTLETIHNICFKPVPRLVFYNDSPILRLSVTLMSKRVEALQLVPLPVLISQYQSWITRTLIPPSLRPTHCSGPSTSASYISITSDESSESTSVESDLADLIISRFSPIPALCQQKSHYGNEIFVMFAPTIPPAGKTDFLRNVCMFPGQGLSYEDSGMGVTVGSFYVYERFPHSIGAVRLGFEHYESSPDGIITYLGLAKTTPPYTESEPPIEFGLAVTYVYAAPDSSPAVQASSSNYRHIRYYNARDPFTYMSSAFHMPFLLRNKAGDVEPELLRASQCELFLELHRPLYGAHSGGTFFLFKLNKAAGAVSVALPFFTGKLQPPSKTYPRYKSQLTYYPICTSGTVAGYSALSFLKSDAAVGSVDIKSSINLDLIQFLLECVESVTYKQRDRLVFPIILYRMLPRSFGAYCLDLGATCIPRAGGAPDTQVYPDCAIFYTSLSNSPSNQDGCYCYKRAEAAKYYQEQLHIPGPRAYVAQIGTREIRWDTRYSRPLPNSADPAARVLEEHFCIKTSLCPYIPTSPNYYVLVLADLLSNLQTVEPDEQQQGNLRLFLETYISTIIVATEFTKAKISADARQYLLTLHDFTLQKDSSMVVYCKK